MQQRLYPVMDQQGRMIGALPRRWVIDHVLSGSPAPGPLLSAVMVADPVTTTPGVTLRTAATLMADSGVTRLPVVDEGSLVGILSLSALLAARLRDLTEDRDTERLIKIRIRGQGGQVRSRNATVNRGAG